MTEPTKRRWSFSLRTLFVAVTLVACWLGWNLHQVHERERMLTRDNVFYATVRGDGSPPLPDQKPPLLWRLLGARTIVSVNLNPDNYTDDDLRRYEKMFPEASVSRAPVINPTLMIDDPGPEQINAEPIAQ